MYSLAFCMFGGRNEKIVLTYNANDEETFAGEVKEMPYKMHANKS